MQNSNAYICFMRQISAIGNDKKDGYYPQIMEEIYEWERGDVEDIIWDRYMNKEDIGVAQFLPKLRKYDGIKSLKSNPLLNKIPSEASVELGRVLYEATNDDEYLGIIKKNIDADPDNISFVAVLSNCRPSQKLKELLVNIYVNNDNCINRNTAVMGLLRVKGIITDCSNIQESNDTIELRKKFKSEDIEERRCIINKFINSV